MTHDIPKYGYGCLVVAFLMFGQPTTEATAQYGPQSASHSVIQAGQQGFNNGPVMPAGLSRTVSEHVLTRPHVPSADKQIRVDLRYVMLDPETRKQFYARLGVDRLKTVGSKVPTAQALPDDAGPAATRGTELLAKSSRVTTCILDSKEMSEFMQDVAASAGSNITRAPSVVLIDGQNTELSDMVQRPFVVDLQRQVTEQVPTVSSVIQVLNEGLTVHLSAAITPSNRIHISSHLTLEKIVDVQSEEVFGVSDDPTVVQVPVHQRKSIRATENLTAGQTLLIDPYVKHAGQITQQTGVPFLSSLPYVADSFKNTSVVPIEQQMVVLIQPMIEKPAARPLPR